MLETTILQTLTSVEALNDQSTSEHASRLVALAEGTARSLHLSNERISLLRLAARLHDIGKVCIPHAILQKTLPLTEEEWAVMRTHTEVGYRILMQAGGIFARVAPIVLAHHERWDGRGYPYGLSGHEIPLEARIIAVVDAFDAMRSERCYRKSLSFHHACNELIEGCERQFDPQVVEAFLAIVNDWQRGISLQWKPAEAAEVLMMA
ncbi:MAG TPA: HD-GYP domain-containing protein [Ktedonobacteraceae bacterium]|jgi:HD-GYP domain-containing protein (c-di-GMP phosphodiesterase class II)|nr:HD-GYP domain-containing protein [Ktedonobacteraceae bacterium]